MNDTSGDATTRGTTHQNPVTGEEQPAPDQQPDGRDVVAGREKPPEQTELSDDELEEERTRRLDPENRPEHTEVDNTQRTFDPISGTFEDDDRVSPNAPFEDPSESV